LPGEPLQSSGDVPAPRSVLLMIAVNFY
jgi:hypothetical protein